MGRELRTTAALAYDRCVTVREMARLHGFPDWFRFNATKWHGARQIGNAVPPPLARAVATSIFKALGKRRTRPTKALELGDETLLTMGNTEAAAHFGVKNPIGRRDKKSGAKKRKQSEIELAKHKATNIDNLDVVNVSVRAELDDPNSIQVVAPQSEAAHG